MSAPTAAAFTLRNRPEDLVRLIPRLHAFGEQAGLGPRAAGRTSLVIEELVANAIAHGYPPDGDGTISVEIRVRPDHVAIAIQDDGCSFDPFSQAAPDIVAALEDRPVGGLGLHLVRSMVRSCGHRRADGRNWLDLTVDRDA